MLSGELKEVLRTVKSTGNNAFVSLARCSEEYVICASDECLCNANCKIAALDTALTAI